MKSAWLSTTGSKGRNGPCSVRAGTRRVWRRGLPGPVQDQLISAMHTVLKDSEFKRSSLDTFSFEPVVESQADFIKFLDQRKSVSARKVAAAQLSVN